jgi:hypothetical protein
MAARMRCTELDGAPVTLYRVVVRRWSVLVSAGTRAVVPVDLRVISQSLQEHA